MSDETTRLVRGNDHLDRLLADPEAAADVATTRAEVREMDRTHAMSLAMIRKAGELTQVEVSQRLGVGQGVVSRLENRDDMLLSTLFDYLTAAGAEGARIVVTLNGHEVDLDLASLPNQRTRASHDAR
jgi:DNA-binding transcriptional regulator YiaG